MPRPRKFSKCPADINCELLLGIKFQQCPNYRECKSVFREVSITNPPRFPSCVLPYTYLKEYSNKCKYTIDPHTQLIVSSQLEPEAMQAGWHSSVKLFYEYYLESHCLLIGGDNWIQIPKDAQELGFAKAEDIPYHYKAEILGCRFAVLGNMGGSKATPPFSRSPKDFQEEEATRLTVVNYSSMDGSYPDKYKDAGWYPPVQLPYYVSSSRYLYPSEDGNNVSALTVSYSIEKSNEYAQAITSGWYPAEEIPTLVDLPYYFSCDADNCNISPLNVYFRTNDKRYAEAITSGWYPAVDLFYNVCFDNDDYTYFELEVARFNINCIEYAEAIKSGWYPPVKLPYSFSCCDDQPNCSKLQVFFNTNSLEEYEQAISAGWYPAEKLPENR